MVVPAKAADSVAAAEAADSANMCDLVDCNSSNGIRMTNAKLSGRNATDL